MTDFKDRIGFQLQKYQKDTTSIRGINPPVSQLLSELWPIFEFQGFKRQILGSDFFMEFCWILVFEFTAHPNKILNCMADFKARRLLGSKKSKTCNLQKRYYQASISIIERVMANLPISGFYNTDFRRRFFLVIFYSGFYPFIQSFITTFTFCTFLSPSGPTRGREI